MIERYGYSTSHTRDLLGNGGQEKIAGVWLVDPPAVQEYQAGMERLGTKKHGIWADVSSDGIPALADPSSSE